MKHASPARKRPARKRPAAATPQPLAFPIVQVSVADLIDRMDEKEIEQLLADQSAAAWEAYVNAYMAHHQRLREPDAYKLKEADRQFRGVEDRDHPMYNGGWSTMNGGGGHVSAQLDRALKAGDWQEVMVLAGMMCVREMLYGRTVAPAAKAAAAAKAKAVRKTAQKKPAAKKPDRQRPRAEFVKAKGKPGSPIGTLKALVEQARPLFEKNPKLDRQGLINKIGRRYERLTTFDELRTLCAGKTVTTHSVKKPAPTAAELEKAFDVEQDKARKKLGGGKQVDQWPFPTGKHLPAAPKAKRPRRDPARPVELSESSIPKGVRTKPWPKPDTQGRFDPADAEHTTAFNSGMAHASFATIETDNGWTHGFSIHLPRDQVEMSPLIDTGPLAQDPDTAIRDVTATLLVKVKAALKDADGEHRELLATHVPDLEKLRSWLLGFQARGVEKIAFLKKAQQEPELAA